MSNATAYPLAWPKGVPRTPVHAREYARFRKRDDGWLKSVSVAESLKRLQYELNAITRTGQAWRVTGVVISSNVELRRDGLPMSGRREPDDPGVCAYFHLDGKPHALPCDKWHRAADNIVAIAKHVEAIRGMERWGVANVAQMFAGFAALPPASGPIVEGQPPWYHVLGVEEAASLADIERAYRHKARIAHPDTGGSHEEFLRLQDAINTARALRKGGLQEVPA